MSTYSTNLALELITAGDQSGTWGLTTNTNLGSLIEQAISGYTTTAMTSNADTTITIPNGAIGEARNMYIEIPNTLTLTAARVLTVPANKKLYFVYNNNNSSYAVTVKTSAGTGISVPNGARMLLVCDGTNVVSAVSYFASLTLGTPLSVANGGTGQTSSDNLIAFFGAIPAADLPTVGDSLIGVGTSLATSATSGTGTTATLTFAAQPSAPFIVGQTIIVAGVTPTTYNTTATVLTCSTTQVTYSSTATGVMTVVGTVSAKIGRLPAAATVTANATTSDIWGARYNTLSGSAVAFTTVANAPYVGAISFVASNAVHTLTTGPTLSVQGGSYVSVAGASGNGTTATLTFSVLTAAPFLVGQSITVAGITGGAAGYNGTYTVTACTTSSVSFATSVSAAYTSGGTVGSNYTCASGDILMFTALTTSTFRVAILRVDGAPVMPTGVNGNVLTSNGTTWVSSTPASNPYIGSRGQVFKTVGTFANGFTIPANVSAVKVTVVGGGGNGNTMTCGCYGFAGAGGGAGATSIKYLTGLDSGKTLTVIVGAAGSTSQVTSGTGGTAQTIAATISATGGATTPSNYTYGGLGGTASGGDIDIGGSDGGGGGAAGNPYSSGGAGGSSTMGGGGRGATYNIFGTTTAAVAGKAWGGGGGGGQIYGGSGASGASGVVIFEW
jgi:hypothetical protein